MSPTARLVREIIEAAGPAARRAMVLGAAAVAFAVALGFATAGLWDVMARAWGATAAHAGIAGLYAILGLAILALGRGRAGETPDRPADRDGFGSQVADAFTAGLRTGQNVRASRR